MLLNTKCERCNEPTKHVVGFWDGENGKSGFVHDCENEKCEVRQLIKVTETKAMQERFRIQNLNSRKRMYAVHSSITERRKNIDDGNVKDCRLQSG
jgi:hypothetical protein